MSKLNKLNSIVASYKNKLQTFPNKVRIIEVGPRDGLQNEKQILSTNFKIQMINQLSKTGLDYIESTSFVSPKWVPQMADNYDVFTQIEKNPNIVYSALVPNLKGYEQAKKADCKEIAVFTAASESFNKKNINCSIQESLDRFKPVIQSALTDSKKVRGYVSCVMGCPYEGPITPESVNKVALKLLEMGCYEVSLGDTIGIGTPELTHKLMQSMEAPIDRLAVHFHDTGDKAIENIQVALGYGIRVIDSSVAGLGGCPYANTTAGNVCSENVVYVLNELGVSTGVDLEKLKEVGVFVSEKLERENLSAI